MASEGTGRSDGQILAIRPLSIALDAAPEAVLIALLRCASRPITAMPTEEQQAPAPLVERAAQRRPGRHPLPSIGEWTARRQPARQEVIYTLKSGPLPACTLRFLAQPDGRGATALMVTGDYTAPRSLIATLRGRRPRREVEALCEGVLTALRAALAEEVVEEAHTMRESARTPVSAHARLYVGERDWPAEVLDVSEGGLALVLAVGQATVRADIAFLRSQERAQVELTLSGRRERIPMLIRRAGPQRGGIGVGLQAQDPERIMPLLNKATARAKPTTP